MSQTDDADYHFRISLSVLEHLGRNLYRSFITIVGEAISNSWDADANTVNIIIDREKGTLLVWDDGTGMTKDDFENKFLNVGYSKREEFGQKSDGGRPFIGAKGIGKLALLSCSKQVTVVSKTENTEFVGGLIDNEALDDAIQGDKETEDYALDTFDLSNFPQEVKEIKKGTAIFFDGINDGIKNRIPFIRQQIAKYFRFSRVDETFRIFVNKKEITHADLKSTFGKTEFLWKINGWDDTAYSHFEPLKEKFTANFEVDLPIGGYIASVVKPRDLSITGLDDRMGVDLFVNGRLRQRDILSLIKTARVGENYLHGQVFFDALDADGEDRFTSSREGVKEDDGMFRELRTVLRKDVILKIVSQWDEWRLENNEEGDDEEKKRKTPSQRRAISLLNYELEDYSETLYGNEKLQTWIKCFRKQAEFNIPSYVQMFLSENLLRKYIKDQSIGIKKTHNSTAEYFRGQHNKAKSQANINYPIREDGDLSYLAMSDLANMVDGPKKTNHAGLSHDATRYKPPRDTIAHTAFLNDDGKKLLTETYKNIVHRLNHLLRANGKQANVSEPDTKKGFWTKFKEKLKK